MIFYMAGLNFNTGMEAKQIFSIPPDPKPRKKRVDDEINIVLRVESNIQRMS
jgi:hypothetical protein